MSGGKGGSTTQSVQIPSWMEDAARRNLGRAEQTSQLGYMPYYGPDVAAPSPMLQSAWQGVSDQAGAFGLGPRERDVMAGMPTAKTYEGGVTGYSSGDLYDQALAEFRTRRPGQAANYDLMFVDPQTGLMPQPGQQQPAPIEGQPVPMQSGGEGGGAGQGFDGGATQPAVYGVGATVPEWLGERFNQMSPLQRAFSPLSAIGGSVADQYMQSQGYTYNPYGDQLEGGGYVSDTYFDYGSDSDNIYGADQETFSKDHEFGGGYYY